MGNVEAGLETARLLMTYERPLIRNAWYCAAWADEVGTDMLARRILNEPIVLYRKQAGQAVALQDICPHKLAPMSQGKKVGDNLQCGYHGLEFDCTGKCVRNPQGNGQIPNQATLRAFPLVERYGVLWIWMGDAERADPAVIPDLSHLNDTSSRTVKGGHHVNANYMLLVENLLDLGHALFLHKGSAGVADDVVLSEASIEQEGNSIHDLRLYRNAPALKIFAGFAPAAICDNHSDIHWYAPSILFADNGNSLPGRARDGTGAVLLGTHLVTPETQHTMHYFYAHTRNFANDDPAIDERFLLWQRNALNAEDSRVAEAIDRLLPDTLRLGVNMVTLSTDVSGIRANRILDRMAAAEA